MQKEITVYTPNDRRSLGLIKTWIVMFRNIVNSRELIYQLFKRDFLMQYKKSFLGMTWIFISPIIGIASWVFLNAAGILNPGDVGIPFPAYVLLSSSIWGLFMGFYGAAAGTLGAGSGFIMQVKFPHEALLIKQTAQFLANFTLTFALNIAVLLAFGVIPTWYILLFPILILPLFFFGAGLGLLISVISVVATDISSFFGTFLGFVMYITPVIYSPNVENELLSTLIELNPLTYLVGGVRDLIIYGTMDFPERYLLAGVATFIFFLLSWRLFFVSEDKVIERMI